MTGEMARGMSTSASSSHAPGKRCRARMRETPTPNTVLSGTAMAATSSESQSACSASGALIASHAVAEPVLKGAVEHRADGQEDEHGQVAEDGEAQRQAPAGPLHAASGTSKRRRIQPMASSTISAMATSSTDTALAAGQITALEEAEDPRRGDFGLERQVARDEHDGPELADGAGEGEADAGEDGRQDAREDDAAQHLAWRGAEGGARPPRSPHRARRGRVGHCGRRRAASRRGAQRRCRAGCRRGSHGTGCRRRRGRAG